MAPMPVAWRADSCLKIGRVMGHHCKKCNEKDLNCNRYCPVSWAQQPLDSKSSSIRDQQTISQVHLTNPCQKLCVGDVANERLEAVQLQDGATIPDGKWRWKSSRRVETVQDGRLNWFTDWSFRLDWAIGKGKWTKKGGSFTTSWRPIASNSQHLPKHRHWFPSANPRSQNLSNQRWQGLRIYLIYHQVD